MTNNPYSRPIQIFSWHQPFLPALKRLIERDAANDSSSALVIVPNLRSWRFFYDLYRQDHKAQMLPKILPYAELLDLWSAAGDNDAGVPANQLDLAALAREAVLEAAESSSDLAEQFADMDIKHFLPWAFKLSDLFEELFKEGLAGADIPFARNDVPPRAAALLESIGKINARWIEGLKKRGWSTPGYKTLLAIQNASRIPPTLMPSTQRRVYIAGFYGLDNVQERLFKALWRQGATICFHTHPALAAGAIDFPGTELHAKWLKKWSASAELAEEAAISEPEFQFFQGCDLHSQIKELSQTISKPVSGTTAVILNDPAALLPVLYEAPQTDINVSMGYPLTRSQILQLIQLIFAIAKNRSEAGGYYWKDLLKFFSQPFLQSLWSNPQKDQNPFTAIFAILRNGRKYVNTDDLLFSLQPIQTQEFLQFLTTIIKISIKAVGGSTTTRQLADALSALLDFILARPADDSEASQIEAEAITRIRTQVIAVLRENALADEELDNEMLEAIFQNLIMNERIPFEADSLVGIQILGMLETRLLQFDNVIILDANDDLLPGHKAQDPLLPDSLRALLGLPDNRRSELIAEHNFFRLCFGAKNVKLYWQEGSAKSELFDSKKIRSRFIEQTLWQLEKKNKKLITQESDNYGRAVASLAIRPEKPKGLQKNPILEKKLRQFLHGHLSPTILDAYYRCPLAFAREKLLGLRSPGEVQEGDNPAWVGTVIHAALKEFYEKYLGQKIIRNDNEIGALHAELMSIFKKIIANEDDFAQLPLDSAIMLELGANSKFYKMLKEGPLETEIYKLEWQTSTLLPIAGEKVNCKIIVDRMDVRNGKHYLLDYKTFKLKSFDGALWKDEEFFAQLEDATANAQFDSELNNELFLALRHRLPSLQLPFYLMVLRAIPGLDPGGAAYVDLYSTGKEQPLFPQMDEKELQKALDYCEICVNFVASHLFNSPLFQGNGETCEWCETAPICSAQM